MASDSRVRAADADREQTAAALREHLAVGRLTTPEFEERLDKAYAAETHRFSSRSYPDCRGDR
jgi:hypothetical protein